MNPSTRKTSWPLAFLGSIILALGAIPANATPLNRSWVSRTGTDGSTCGSITSPCASFQGALSNTAAGGEIDCLTPGDFGGASTDLYVNQSVSIVCDGVSNGGIFNKANQATITVNAGSGAVVYLSGLDLEGAGTGSQGVNVASASQVHIVHCTIRGFTEYGVLVASNTTTRVLIKDSVLVKDGTGLSVSSVGGATNGVITNNTIIDGNLYYAANADTQTGPSAIAVIRTLLTGSTDGLALVGGASGDLIGPSNTINGAIIGSPTSVPFK